VRNRTIVILLFFIVFSFSGSVQARHLIDTNKLIKYINKSLKQWQNPGLPKNIVNIETVCGTYKCDMYDDVIVEHKNDSVLCDFLPSKIYRAVLEPINNNVFSITMINDPSLPKGFVTFGRDNEGNVVDMEIDIPNMDFDFTELDLKKY